MEVAYAVALLIIGFTLLLLEVFIPSLGALTLMSMGAFFGAFYFAFEVNPIFGWTLIGVSAVGIPTSVISAFKVFPKTALGKHMILFRQSREEPTAPHEQLSDYAGKSGLTVSTLRPSGIARIAGQRVDVVTRGEMIGPGVKVRVIEVLGNRIVVRAVSDAPPPETDRELS
jgi:membrane-bound serine protease (ClpP class)